MDLELVSTKICPYAQRSVITMLHKSINHRITYLDLANPPAWFKEISPFGNVPLLRVDGDTVLFESGVINEFLDEVSPPSLHPTDPVNRAINRAWIEFGSECLANQSQMLSAREQDAFEQKQRELVAKMQRLEDSLGDGPFFNGPGLSLADTTYAPLFMRLLMVMSVGVLNQEILGPRTRRWADSLLALDAVRNSVVNNFEDLFLGHLKKMGGYAAQLIAR